MRIKLRWTNRCSFTIQSLFVYLWESQSFNSHSMVLLVVVRTLTRDGDLCEVSAQSPFSPFQKRRLICSMRWSHCFRRETQGTMEQACEECRKWNWSDIRRVDEARRRQRLFWHGDWDATRRAASLWLSGHEIEIQGPFIELRTAAVLFSMTSRTELLLLISLLQIFSCKCFLVQKSLTLSL